MAQVHSFDDITLTRCVHLTWIEELNLLIYLPVYQLVA